MSLFAEWRWAEMLTSNFGLDMEWFFYEKISGSLQFHAQPSN
jgi:hypothetical protein